MSMGVGMIFPFGLNPRARSLFVQTRWNVSAKYSTGFFSRCSIFCPRLPSRYYVRNSHMIYHIYNIYLIFRHPLTKTQALFYLKSNSPRQVVS